jgi:D-serine deaminase-like pyridoxal phosphate-dependent protein
LNMADQDILYTSLNTPAVLLDLDKLEANIREISRLAAEAGVKLKPHTKIHACAEIARMQIEAGASGIEVGAIEQAEPMVDGGIEDIVVAHPFFGNHKLEILKRLLKKSGVKITVVVDMIEQAEDISQVGQSFRRKVPALIKIDTGVARYGVLPGEPTLNLARKLQQLPGIELAGIYAHESGANVAKGVDNAALEVASIMSEVARMLKEQGFTLETVGVGASPTFRSTCRYLKEGRFPEITEVHPGALIVGDNLHVIDNSNTRESCALTVLTAVVSTSHPNHVVIDAGFKTFGGDSMIAYRDTPGFFWQGKPSWGYIRERRDLWFGRVTSEAGVIYYMEGAKRNLKLGDRLQIIPNNATIVINTHSKMYGVKNGVIERVILVTGKEKGN